MIKRLFSILSKKNIKQQTQSKLTISRKNMNEMFILIENEMKWNAMNGQTNDFSALFIFISELCYGIL